MIRTFTLDDLIKYIYHETTEEESRDIKQAMLCDAELERKFKELSAIIKTLDEAEEMPSSRVTDSILNYSKSLNLLPNK